MQRACVSKLILKCALSSRIFFCHRYAAVSPCYPPTDRHLLLTCVIPIPGVN
jgi:hypothetical protein